MFKTKKRMILAGICSVLAAGGVASGLYVNAKLSKINTNKIEKKEIKVNEDVDKEQMKGYTNIALFGIDARDTSLEKDNRADCMIVASINNDSGEIKLVSLYRDTYLDLAGKKTAYDKANSAYAQGGPKQAINMLNKNLDMNIEDYVTVNFKALADAIDLMGGIDIEITEQERIHLNNYAIETSKVSKKKTTKVKSAGMQHLDGVQAVSYARIRYTAGDDFKRTERQRIVLEKLFEIAKKTDLGTLNKVLDAVFPEVSTSLTTNEIISLGTNALKYKMTDQTGFPFNVDTGKIDGKSCVWAKDLEKDVSELHKLLFDTEDYKPSRTVKAISNKIKTVKKGTSDKENKDYTTDSKSKTTGNTTEKTDSGETNKKTTTQPKTPASNSQSSTPNTKPAETPVTPTKPDSGSNNNTNDNSNNNNNTKPDGSGGDSNNGGNNSPDDGGNSGTDNKPDNGGGSDSGNGGTVPDGGNTGPDGSNGSITIG